MSVTTVGKVVQVTAETGLKARKSPGGAVAKDANGKEIVRAKGYKFTNTARKQDKDKKWWVQAKTYWYSEQYLKNVTAPKPSPGKVNSPAPGYRITTPFGKKPPPGANYWKAKGYHTGDDYAAPAGAKCVAVRSGRTVYKWDGSLGNCLLLYGDNNRTYWYCHLKSKPKTGPVKAGATVGYVGQTGSGARGNHLHFEMRAGHTTSWQGKPLDPSW